MKKQTGAVCRVSGVADSVSRALRSVITVHCPPSDCPPSNRLTVQPSTVHRLLSTLATLLLLASFAPRAEAVSATGGTVTNYTTGTAPNQTNWTAHIFTTVGTTGITVNLGGSVEILVVGGGGGGGNRVGGGGGGGGVVYATNYTLTAGTNYIVIGDGGAGSTQNGVAGLNGYDSVFNTNGAAGFKITALGGGGGGSYNGCAPRTGGGSGGGRTF